MSAYQDTINAYIRDLERRNNTFYFDANRCYTSAKKWFEINYPEATQEQYQSFCTKAAAKLGLSE